MNTFPKIKGRVLHNEPLSRHTTFRIGGPCRAWVEAEDEADLKKILAFAKSKRKKIFVIGAGSNVLAGDKGFTGIVIHLGKGQFKNIEFSDASVRVGAGVMLGRLVDLACKRGLAGMEGLVGIPGTVGGAVFASSGYRKNIGDLLEKVRVMDKKKAAVRIIKRKNLKFGYRHSNLDRYIILEAWFRLKRNGKKALLERKKRLLGIKKEEQPLGSFSAGCIFKNPQGRIPAARYIDISGLKGKRIGGAKISERHANFIVNLKNAKARDVLCLMDLVKKRIKSRFNVNLVPEIIII